MIIGYARVSSNHQDTELQMQALRAAGCKLIFEEKASGRKTNRPILKKVVEMLEPGDELVIWKLDRIGRNVLHALLTFQSLAERNVIFVGLGEGSALPVGVPVPWPSATPPTGWLKCNGAAFSAEEYPELAKAYPTKKVPDLRGEFIRGWDDGRDVDSGRALLSEQLDAMQNVTGSLSDNTMGASLSASGVFNIGSSSGVKYAAPSAGSAFSFYSITLDLSRSARTSAETRPRNIAFNYIVRAA